MAIVDVSDPATPRRQRGTLPTDPHPDDIVLTSDDRLFVSCGNANSVISYDLKTLPAARSDQHSLGPKAPAGSTPNSLALSPDGEFLYVANADNNSLAVIEVEDRRKSKPLGFIPTGWYPTFVTTSPDGKRIIGRQQQGQRHGSHARETADRSHRPRSQFSAYGQSAERTRVVHRCSECEEVGGVHETGLRQHAVSRYAAREVRSAGHNGDSRHWVGQRSPIEHVLFIMKENRTYDQVFGDLKQGNGDPSLTLFGRDVTPNQHALAEQFVLLDNLYCSGEVSQDGQPWTTSAYVTDFTQRAWTLSYSRHGRVNVGGRIREQSTPYIWELARSEGC